MQSGFNVDRGAKIGSVSGSSAPEVERAPEVNAALESLEYQLDILSARIADLNNRLAPVMRNEPTEKDSGNVSRVFNAPLACAISQRYEQVAGMNKRVDLILSLLEI